MKTVLMITKYFYPTLGGVERYVHEISTRLATKDYRVKVIVPSLSNRCSHERVGNYEVFRFPTFSWKRLDFSPRMHLFVRSAKFDIIHFHTFEVLCRILQLGLKRNTPCFITTHGFFWEDAKNPLGYLLKALGATVIRDNFVNARKIFCVSRIDRRSVMKIMGQTNHPQEKVTYLPCGVDTKKFRLVDRENSKKRYLCSDKIVITQISRFSPKKGQAILLEALSKLDRKIQQNCIFLFAGFVQDRRYFDGLQKRAEKLGLKDAIIFLPNVADDDLVKIYAGTDIFVLPSLAEGFPLSILEAWASGCSVIASEVGDIPYFVKDGHDCYTVQPGNADILSDTILDLVRNEELRKRLSINGYKRATHEFSWDRVVNVISKEYDSALGC